MSEPSSVSSVLITGASGFIGSTITRRLASMSCYRVRAGSRRRQQHAFSGVTACEIDLLEFRTLVAACEGVDAVIHCAVGDRTTTVDGTANLLRAAEHAGVRRLVHLSSIAVYGPASGTVSETAPLVSPRGAHYANWKSATEALCRTVRNVEIILLRPTIVYGAGSALWIDLMARRILSGRWGTFGVGGEGICNPVHVADVADAACAALSAGAPGEAYNINGPTHLTWNEWFAELARAIGAGPLTDHPPAVWRRRSFFALPAKAIRRVMPSARSRLQAYTIGAPAVSERELFALRAVYTAERAARDLAWQARIDVPEGLAESAAWLRKAGIAPVVSPPVVSPPVVSPPVVPPPVVLQ